MEEIIIKHREFKEKLAKLINESGLLAFMIKPIIKEFLNELEQIEEEQYKQALKTKEEKNNEKEEKNGQD